MLVFDSASFRPLTSISVVLVFDRNGRSELMRFKALLSSLCSSRGFAIAHDLVMLCDFYEQVFFCRKLEQHR